MIKIPSIEIVCKNTGLPFKKCECKKHVTFIKNTDEIDKVLDEANLTREQFEENIYNMHAYSFYYFLKRKKYLDIIARRAVLIIRKYSRASSLDKNIVNLLLFNPSVTNEMSVCDSKIIMSFEDIWQYNCVYDEKWNIDFSQIGKRKFGMTFMFPKCRESIRYSRLTYGYFKTLVLYGMKIADFPQEYLRGIENSTEEIDKLNFDTKEFKLNRAEKIHVFYFIKNAKFLELANLKVDDEMIGYKLFNGNFCTHPEFETHLGHSGYLLRKNIY